MNVEPLDFADLLANVAKFYEARARSDDKQAMLYAETVMVAFRSSLTEHAVLSSRFTANRSLWRLAKSGELDTYINNGLAREVTAAILADRSIMGTVARRNLNADFQPVTVPKQMVTHEATLSVLIVPLKGNPP